MWVKNIPKHDKPILVNLDHVGVLNVYNEVHGSHIEVIQAKGDNAITLCSVFGGSESERKSRLITILEAIEQGLAEGRPSVDITWLVDPVDAE